MLRIAGFVLVLAGLAGVAEAQRLSANAGYVAMRPTIAISCYRGPWQQVIWDRPQPEFIDSLVAAGYDIATASAIANRICRDPALVNDPAGLRKAVARMLRETPVRN
ncbi:hypothetical protein [Pseudoruegeria sp. HB172150]|uniref:hypothetical protein n=1 Tax=Pseudoruegeria sp. HB172150 TaxID=2721164 RepID=UPI0015533A01|nr:hypothetical protein [Pseudoruegeria sp. HB172150]